MSIRATDNLEYCVCGNIVALQGIDSLLTKCGTIASSPQVCPFPFPLTSLLPFQYSSNLLTQFLL